VNYSKEEVYYIGRNQKTILWLIIAFIASSFIHPYVTMLVIIINIVFVYKLAKAEKSSIAWLCALLQLIPLINIICLLILNNKATKILKKQGIRVGLIGVSNKDLKNLIKE